MAKDLSLAQGIGTDADFLNGNLKDNQTVVNEHINQDIVQFFQKLMADAGLTANGDFDNEANGYQFIDALADKVLKTSDPAWINVDDADLLNSWSLSSSSDFKFVYRKINNIVEVYIAASSDYTASDDAEDLIYTLPTGYRPQTVVSVPFTVPSIPETYIIWGGNAFIDTSGNVKIQRPCWWDAGAGEVKRDRSLLGNVAVYFRFTIS